MGPRLCAGTNAEVGQGRPGGGRCSHGPTVGGGPEDTYMSILHPGSPETCVTEHL